MIITKSWLNEFVDLSDVSVEKICETLNNIGLEVDNYKSYRIPEKVILGKVISKEKHPDADKLSVCQVDLGTYTRQIVCGARNVEEGQYVAVATLGCKLTPDFEIKPVKLRGVESDGMICSSLELGLPQLNDGILVLDKSIGNFDLGCDLSKNKILNDDVIEIELTANRGDALSIRGVARDLAVALELSLIQHSDYKDDNTKGVGRVLQFTYDYDIDAKLGYKVVELKETKNILLIDLRLKFIESKIESFYTKLTTYLSHSIGVNLRVYEYDFFYDKLKEKSIIHAKKDSRDILTICDKNSKAVSQVGINQLIQMNNEDMKKVIFEISFIKGSIVSKAVYENNLKSDEHFYRSSRGSETDIVYGFNYISQFLSNNFHCDIYAGLATYSSNYKEKIISLNARVIESVIGQNIDSSTIVYVLQNLGFKVTINPDTTDAIITIPEFRQDISNINDVIEEIVRIVGINNIVSKPLSFKQKKTIRDTYQKYRMLLNIRQLSVAQGFHETITYIFGHKSLQEKYKFPIVDENLDILNPITSELDTFRTTMMINHLNAIINNQKYGYNKIALFEIGSIYESNRAEKEVITFTLSGYKEETGVANHGKPKEIDFEYFMTKLSAIFGNIELQDEEIGDNNFIHPYQNGVILKNGIEIGIFTKLHSSVQKEHELNTTYFAQIEVNNLHQIKYEATDLSKFQHNLKDLTLQIDSKESYTNIKRFIETKKYPHLMKFFPLDVFKPKDENSLNLTIRFVLQSFEKTLEESDINVVMKQITEDLTTKFANG